MFRKPIKIKSSVQLKTTEKKTLKQTFLSTFRTLSEQDLNIIVPKKEAVVCMKVLTAENVTAYVYLVQKRAIAFEVNGILYPSVYLLWRFNYLTINFVTTAFVISKLIGGADLMLPGVISKSQEFEKNQTCSININTNTAALAVGVTALCSFDINAANPRGKCAIVYHVHGDKLCSLEDMPVLPIPNLGVPSWLAFSVYSTNEFPALGTSSKNKSDISPVEIDSKTPIQPEDTKEEPQDTNDVLQDTNDEPESTKDDKVENTEVNETEEMDKILLNSFLTAIKYSKTLQLPVLASTFYKLEIMPLIPPDKSFDIKKTSYKKVGQFLKYMIKEGVIVVTEKKKGVETLEKINFMHTMLLDFYVEAENRPRKPAEANLEEMAAAPNIVESYAITNAVLPIFNEYGLKKGDTLSLPDVRNYITSYIKTHDLQHKPKPSLVDVKDSKLAAVCKTPEPVEWEKLMNCICSAMTSCYKVTSSHEETFSKGKIQPIMMTVQTRSGNKKVTLIDNLPLYGIRMTEFAKECQHGVAASTTISKPPGKKTEQLLVQGNQILFVYHLLIDKYKIPKKYIRGLENAPKTKK